MLRIVFLWASLAACFAAHAGGFAIVPLRVELGPNKAGSITITNTDEAKTFEVRAVSWKQQNRQDSYAPTDELLLAPATFKLEKGATQVVRIQLNKPQDAAERPYRIFIDEVPPSNQVKSNALKTVVSMVVPVFVAPASGPIAKGEAAVSVALVKDVLQIEMRNTGKANLKMREFVVTSAKAGELLKVPSAAYVLAGNTMTGQYPLKMQADGPMKLQVVTDRGTFTADIKR
ncbi:MAG: molecular chaperone [Ramlibacter sp.]|nr:fimbria/pilus periplasmic chaperone [Ramlibacter sp.]